MDRWSLAMFYPALGIPNAWALILLQFDASSGRLTAGRPALEQTMQD